MRARKFFQCLLGSAFVSAASLKAQIANAPPVPEWIAAPADGSTAFFCKAFEFEGTLLKAILLAACQGRASLYLNGKFAGDVTARDRATSLDVSAHVRPGRNVLAARVHNPTGNAALSVRLELNGDLAGQRWIASDSTWRAATNAFEGWNRAGFAAPGWSAARSLGQTDAPPGPNPFDEQRAFDAYNSWKLALGTNAATDARTFTLPPGFQAELVRSALRDEGSWVAMAFDPQGRLTLGREKRGLLRLTFEAGAVRRVEVSNDTLLECRGLLYAFDSLYANANNSKALYRLRDRDGDGRFDHVEELLRTGGGVGHGRNHLKLGPDGFIYLAHGNNVLPPQKLSEASPLRHFAEDQLIACPWDPSMFDGDVLVPAGHILRIDREAKNVRLIAGGFRNPLDVAFNADGEMFTFDADMEWDVGAPWYMPNRVLHVVSGSDFGFHRGTGRLPACYPDTLDSVCEIGLASPTAVIFGQGSHFPVEYQRALFICDWAYGRILAVHLQPRGASYSGRSELFVSGRPLNVTDACIGPDGALWFITGGRGTQSGLYRVSYSGPPIAERRMTRAKLAREKQAAGLRALRRELEQLHGPPTPGDEPRVLAQVWPNLGHEDAHIRHAARVALERLPVALWQQRALTEKRTARALTAWLALARVGEKSLQQPLLERLNGLDFAALNDWQRLCLLRVYELAFTRTGPPGPASRAAAERRLEALFPCADRPLNQELCKLLVFLESPGVLTKTIPLVANARMSEDLLFYPFWLRYVRSGWTVEAARACVDALTRAEQLPGGRTYFRAIEEVRKELMATVNPPVREALAPLLHKPVVTATNPPAAAFVKDWQMADLAPRLDQVSRGRSFEQGRAALVTAQCVRCHRVSSDPALPAGVIGPDLTAVASRFNRRDLLEQILDPSKIIDEKYQQTTFALADGADVTGTIEREDERRVVVRTDPLAGSPAELPKSRIVDRRVSEVSPMPAGLLNVLTSEQVFNLLAFLETGGNPKAACFER